MSRRSAPRDRVTGALAVRGAPDELVRPHGLVWADYADRFVLTTRSGAAAGAETWARAILGDVPDAGKRLIFAGLCRFTLAPAAHPDRIAGCRIIARGAGHVVLELHGRILLGRLVVTIERAALVDDERPTFATPPPPVEVALATQMRWRTISGRTVWALLAPVHRRLAPSLLRDAADLLAAR